MARRRTAPTLSVPRALEILRVLDTKRVSTFNEADNTVRVMRRTFTRRVNGTIINMDIAQGHWTETRVDVREAAQYALDTHNGRVSNLTATITDYTRDEMQARAELAAAELAQQQLAAVSATLPADVRETCMQTVRDATEKAQRNLAETQAKLADAQSMLAALPTLPQ